MTRDKPLSAQLRDVHHPLLGRADCEAFVGRQPALRDALARSGARVRDGDMGQLLDALVLAGGLDEASADALFERFMDDRLAQARHQATLLVARAHLSAAQANDALDAYALERADYTFAEWLWAHTTLALGAIAPDDGAQREAEVAPTLVRAPVVVAETAATPAPPREAATGPHVAIVVGLLVGLLTMGLALGRAHHQQRDAQARALVAATAQLPAALEAARVGALTSPDAPECVGAGACHQRFGERVVAGQCVQGWCVSQGPGCLRDTDCHSAQACVSYRCDQGQCVADPLADGSRCVDGAGAAGACAAASCERPVEDDARCVRVGEEGGWDPSGCPKPANSCMRPSCDSVGRCLREALPLASACHTSAGARGSCDEAHVCALDEGQAFESERVCTRKRVRYGYYGTRVVNSCTNRMRHRLRAAQLNTTRATLRARIDERVRYEAHIGLIAMPEGGYNIVVTNTRSREDVRGLMDPSFVAFTLAEFTSRTSWRSRHLNIWIDGQREGWTLPTSGSREAMRRGEAASSLGWMGVVDVSAYRRWLEREFRPMPRAARVPILAGPAPAQDEDARAPSVETIDEAFDEPFEGEEEPSP